MIGIGSPWEGLPCTPVEGGGSIVLEITSLSWAADNPCGHVGGDGAVSLLGQEQEPSGRGLQGVSRSSRSSASEWLPGLPQYEHQILARTSGRCGQLVRRSSCVFVSDTTVILPYLIL